MFGRCTKNNPNRLGHGLEKAQSKKTLADIAVNQSLTQLGDEICESATLMYGRSNPNKD
jgi:hypothetical protein